MFQSVRSPLQDIGNVQAPQNTFSELAESFSERIQELKKFTFLRIEGVLALNLVRASGRHLNPELVRCREVERPVPTGFARAGGTQITEL